MSGPKAEGGVAACYNATKSFMQAGNAFTLFDLDNACLAQSVFGLKVNLFPSVCPMRNYQ